MTHEYILGNEPEEIERLKIQSSLFEPITRDALIKAGIKKGARCADIGCGSGEVTKMMREIVGKDGYVLGIDIDNKYIDYCKKNSNYDNVSFIHGDICHQKHLVGEDDLFDIVFSRFMFVHLKDSKNALRSMIKLAGNNGILVVQELDHASDSWLSYPHRDSVDKLRQLYVTLVERVGGDPFAGRKIYKMFVEESLASSVECFSPCLVMGGTRSSLGWRIAKSLESQVYSYGLMQEKDYKGIIADLREMACDRESFVTYARFFSVIGKKC
jgi:ubiquinone/menaquinone biosynthesis C-methylase UbiE